jgi:YggT family protein
MRFIVGLVGLCINIYIFLVLARALLSWFPLRSGTAMYKLYTYIYDVTEPYLRLFRRILPPVRMGNAALDLSPIIGFLLLIVLERLLYAIVPA